RLQSVPARVRAGLLDHPARVDVVLHTPDDQADAVLVDDPITEFDDLVEVVSRIDMHHRERQRGGPERLRGEMQHHHRILAAGEQQRRRRQRGRDLPKNMYRLGFQHFGMEQLVGRGCHVNYLPTRIRPADTVSRPDSRRTTPHAETAPATTAHRATHTREDSPPTAPAATPVATTRHGRLRLHYPTVGRLTLRRTVRVRHALGLANDRLPPRWTRRTTGTNPPAPHRPDENRNECTADRGQGPATTVTRSRCAVPGNPHQPSDRAGRSAGNQYGDSGPDRTVGPRQRRGR